jgi:hypothetical protein
MTERKRQATPSDRPHEDLKKERDAFVQQFFKKGAQFTEELMAENERLRERLSEVEAENGRLRAHVASEDAIRDMLRKIEKLESEKRDLIHRSSQFEAVTGEFTNRYAEVEGELANLANLYVASSQLHSAHSVRNVLRNIKELLAQLLGAAAFAVYYAPGDRDQAALIASEGVNVADLQPGGEADRAVVAALREGKLMVRRRDPSRGTLADPAAAVPLYMDGKVVGVIAIFATLPQKTEFVNADDELFKLLGAQAAPALVNARLFTDAGRGLPPVQAFLDLED